MARRPAASPGGGPGRTAGRVGARAPGGKQPAPDAFNAASGGGWGGAAQKAGAPGSGGRGQVVVGAGSGMDYDRQDPQTDRISAYGSYFGLLPVWGWTVPALVGAIDAHNVGNFALSGRLAEDMAAHPWIYRGISTRQKFFSKCPLNVTPADEHGRPVLDPDQAKTCRGARHADFIREVLPDILPMATMHDLMRHELLSGQGVPAIDWEERRDGRDRWWLPYLKPWAPQLLSYRQFTDPSSVDGGGFVATTLSHGQVRVQPGGGRWALFARRTSQPWLGGAVRMLGDAFVGDGYNFRDLMAYQEKIGQGIVKLLYERGMPQNEVLACAESLKQGSGGGVLMCPGQDGKRLVDAEFVKGDGVGWQSFRATNELLLRRILIALQGQDMLTTGSTGLATNDPRAMSLWDLYQEDCQVYGDASCTSEWEPVGSEWRQVPVWTPRDGVLRTQIMSWVAHFNVGDSRLAPYIWWDGTPPDDYEARADAQATRAQKIGGAYASVSMAMKNGLLTSPRQAQHALRQMGIDYEPEAGQAAPPAGPPPAPPAATAAPAPEKQPAESAERDLDLSEVQVRISQPGAAFHPGHSQGVPASGKAPMSAAQQAHHEATKVAEAQHKQEFLKAHHAQGGSGGEKSEEHKALESKVADAQGRLDKATAAHKSATENAAAAKGAKKATHEAEAKKHAADARVAADSLHERKRKLDEHLKQHGLLPAASAPPTAPAVAKPSALVMPPKSPEPAKRADWKPPAQPPPQFASHAELHAYFKEHYPHHEIDMSGQDLAIANSHARELHTLSHEYPTAFRDHFTKFTPDHTIEAGGMVANLESGHITFHSSYYSSADRHIASMIAEENSNWSPKGTAFRPNGAASTLRHEFGHVLDGHLSKRVDGAEAVNNGSRFKGGKWVDKPASEITGEHGKWRNRTLGRKTKGHASVYAKTDAYEGFAEAFSQMAAAREHWTPHTHAVNSYLQAQRERGIL